VSARNDSILDSEVSGEIVLRVSRYPIAYGTTMRVLGGVLGLGSRRAWIEIDPSTVEICMGWAFRAKFPRSAVRRAAVSDRRSFSLGVHGHDGRWLVNGTTKGLVRIDLDPEQRARVLGADVALNTLDVSVEQPTELLAALEPSR
jgi:hypothetical protein